MVEFKGASDRYSLNLARSLSDLGIDLALVSVEDCIREPLTHYKLINIFPGYGGDTNRLIKLRKYLGAYLFIIRFAMRSGFKFAHFQYFRFLEVDCVFWLIMKLLKFKILYTAHNILPHEWKRYHKYLFKLLYRVFDGIIVTSTLAKRQLESEFGIKSYKIWRIPIGYAGPPASSFLSKEEARYSLAIPLDIRLILFFGLIREYKGIDTLIKAVQLAKGEIENIKLLIVGPSSNNKLLETYSSLTQELGIQDFVEMRVGFVSDEDLPKYISSSDIVAVPYRRASGHSGVLFLAYYFGKPVIATRVGGLCEAVEEGKSGYLVSPDDEIELANAIVKAFRDPENLIKMGENGKKISEREYAWDKIGDATIQVYQQLLSEKIRSDMINL